MADARKPRKSRIPSPRPLDMRRQLRKDNKRNAILSLFQMHEKMSKVMARRLSGYSMTTLINVFDELERDGLIAPAMARGAAAGRGRPHEYYLLIEESRVRVGSTFTWNGFHTVAIGLSGSVLARRSDDVELGFAPVGFIDAYRRHLELFRKENRTLLRNPVGIHAAIPGDIDKDTGVLRSYVLMKDLRNVDLNSILKGVFRGVPLSFDDNTAGFLAYLVSERELLGNARHVAHVSLRAGLSYGTIIDGKVQIANGDIGHVGVSGTEARCFCGRRGCLHLFLSHPALSDVLTQHGVGRDKDQRGAFFSVEEIVKTYQTASADVRDEIDRRFAMLGKVMLDIVNLTAPDLIVLTGGLFKCHGDPAEWVRRSMEKDFHDSGVIPNYGHVRIVYRDLPTEIAAIGLCRQANREDFMFEPE